MQYFFRILTTFCLTLLVTPHATASLPWVVSGQTAAATISSDEQYAYDLSIPLDGDTFAGPLKYTNTTTNVSWIYDVYAYPQTVVGQWYFEIGSQQWIYNFATKEWQVTGGPNVWGQFSHATWKNLTNLDQWSASNDLPTPIWTHTIIDQSNNTFTRQWQHNLFTNAWSDYATGMQWSFNYETFTWTNTSNAESWAVDPLLETLTYTGPGATANRWTLVNKNKWLNQATSTFWEFLPGTNQWQNMETSDTYGFDYASYSWKNQTTHVVAYLPPLVPPLLALQYDTIYATCVDISTNLFILDPLTPSVENYAWTDGTNTLDLNATDFKLTLPTAGITLGRGATYSFNTLYQFASSTGEQWQQTESGSGAGTTLTNRSTGLGTTTTLQQHPGTDRWWQNSTNSGFHWQYHIENDQWILLGSNVIYTFDYTTLNWNEVSGNDNQWNYVYRNSYSDGYAAASTGTNWVWRNATTHEDWLYTTTTITLGGGRQQQGGTQTVYAWKNLQTGEYWMQQGNESVPVYQRTSDMSIWQLDADTKLWACISYGGPTTKKNLFPVIPGTPAGISGFLAHLALTETTSTSGYGSATGLTGRITAGQSSVAAMQTEISALTSSNGGLDLYSAILPTFTQAQILANTYKNIGQEWNYLYFAYNADPFLLPPTSSTFTWWMPTRGFFRNTGQGAFGLRFAPEEETIVIGFSPEPTTDGSATYTLTMGNISSTIDTLSGPITFAVFTITLKKGDTVLHTYGFSPTPEDGTGFTVSYDNGAITIYTGAPLSALFVANGVNVIWSHTITDDPDATTIRYATITASSPTTNIALISYDFDYFHTQLAVNDIANNCQDILTLAPYEEIWNEVKVQLNAIALQKITYLDQYNTAQDIINTLTGVDAIVNPIGDLTAISVDIPGRLFSPTSIPYFHYIFDSMHGAQSLLQLFRGNVAAGTGYYGLIIALQNALTPLLAANATTLTTAEQNALIASVQSAAHNIVTNMAGTFDISNPSLSNFSYGAYHLIHDYVQNSDIAPFANFFLEETAFLKNLSSALSIMSPLALDRFVQQINLYNVGTSEANAALAADQQQREAGRLAIISALATSLAAGNSTIFAAINAAAAVICINNTFDDIRVGVESYLSSNGYTDYHTFPTGSSPLRNYTTAYNTLLSIMNAIEVPISLGGSTFETVFAGTPTQPNAPAAQAYMASTIDATDTSSGLLNQQVSAELGTSASSQNTYVLTQTDDHIRTRSREVVTAADDKTQAYASIYVNNAVVGLGNGNLNSSSDQSASVLGSTSITAEGNSILPLNSDITIIGNTPLIPSSNFGVNPADPTRCVPATAPATIGLNTTVFTSPTPKAITIKSGTAFDLTAFNQANVPGGQTIVFGGQTQLVFEPNTRLIFPYTTPENRAYQLKLIFQDQAQLIFKGSPTINGTQWSDAASGSDLVRTKILGVGTISLTDNAQMQIMNSALVSVEANFDQNVTDVTIELDGSSALYIGDNATNGGSFQVGNIITGGSDNLGVSSNYPNNSNNPLILHPRFDEPFAIHPTQINFTLSIIGSNALCYIGNQGFMGFAVGTVNKAGTINGTTPNRTTDIGDDPTGAPYNTWTLQTLFDVGNISFNLLNGTFCHNHVAQGNSSSAGMLAMGPLVARGNYFLTLNPSKLDLIKGGGNVLFLRDTTTDDANAESASVPVAIWNKYTPLTGANTDNGAYSLLAPAPLIMQRYNASSVRSNFYTYGRAIIERAPSTYQFTGPLDEFYLATTFQQIQNNSKYLIAYGSALQSKVAFINSQNVIQTQSVRPLAVSNRKRQLLHQPSDVIALGHLTTSRLTDRPTQFTLPG